MTLEEALSVAVYRELVRNAHDLAFDYGINFPVPSVEEATRTSLVDLCSALEASLEVLTKQRMLANAPRGAGSPGDNPGYTE